MAAATTRASVRIPRLNAQILPGMVTNALARPSSTPERTARRAGAIPAAPTTRVSVKIPRQNARILPGMVTNAPARPNSTRERTARKAGACLCQCDIEVEMR